MAEVLAWLSGIVAAALGALFAAGRRRQGELEDDLRRAKRETALAELDIGAPELPVGEPDPEPAPEPESPAVEPAAEPPVVVADDAPVGLGERGVLAVTAASGEWLLDVEEPPGRNWERIDRYIRGELGLGWGSASTTVPLAAYTRNRQFAWCGAFMAFCHGAAGLDATVRRYSCASTYRLRLSAMRGRYSDREPEGPSRLWQAIGEGRELSWEPRAGDVLLVGPHGSKPWGKHITLVRSFDPVGGTFETIEGNAKGTGPDGRRHEGVITRSRPMPTRGNRPDYRAMFLLRFNAEDYTGPPVA